MPKLSYTHKMAAYMAWADDVMLKNAEQLSDETLMEPRDTLFKSISGTFDHTLVVAEMFKAHLERRTHPYTARHRDDPLPFRDVARQLREINAFYVDQAKIWTEAELDETIRFEFVGGGAGAMTRRDIILHLANHATYHRGFVSALLFPYKIPFAPNDLTVFLRDIWPTIEKQSETALP
ncbi:DinB family protein [Ruegeria sp. R13_0]|uniref:DinB family protein n=1 Tax=Ruegeria sp. R13_0 TaxID=2821099 RepID=UPI001ADC3C8E|nr:DinB family protein [Ruegeria sp. R13_0]MBO9436387.1 DinB family protein [Ruegeria sp. R13_0]